MILDICWTISTLCLLIDQFFFDIMKPFCLLNAFVLLQSNYIIEMFQLKQKNDPQNHLCISNWIFSISCRLSATFSDNDFRSFLQLPHIGFSWRFVKVWIFWEGHKIWKNLRHTFDKSVVFCARNSVLVTSGKQIDSAFVISNLKLYIKLGISKVIKYA